MGHTSPECQLVAGEPLNMPPSAPESLSSAPQDASMETLLHQSDNEAEHVAAHHHDATATAWPLQPGPDNEDSPREPESPFQLCRLFLNQLGFMQWGKRWVVIFRPSLWKFIFVSSIIEFIFYFYTAVVLFGHLFHYICLFPGISLTCWRRVTNYCENWSIWITISGKEHLVINSYLRLYAVLSRKESQLLEKHQTQMSFS